jgi:hypothetical protein
METRRKEDTGLPGLVVISSREQLERHDPLEPALLKVYPALVPGLWTFLEALTMDNDTGEMCRGIEQWMCGLAEPSSRMMVSGLNRAGQAMRRIMVTAQRMIADQEIERAKGGSHPLVVEMGDGEQEEDS